MNVRVGDFVEIVDRGSKSLQMSRVNEILLHHDMAREPESLQSISSSLFRTLVQDYVGVRVHLRLDTGEELSYGDIEQSIAIANLENGRDQELSL